MDIDTLYAIAQKTGARRCEVLGVWAYFTDDRIPLKEKEEEPEDVLELSFPLMEAIFDELDCRGFLESESTADEDPPAKGRVA